MSGGIAERAYRAALRLYPREYRDLFADEQLDVFRAAWRASQDGRLARAWRLASELSAVVHSALRAQLRGPSRGLVMEGEVMMEESWFGELLRRKWVYALLILAALLSLAHRWIGVLAVENRLTDNGMNLVGLPGFVLLHLVVYCLVVMTVDLPVPAVIVTAVVSMLLQTVGDRAGAGIGLNLYGYQAAAPGEAWRGILFDMANRLAVFLIAAFFIRWLAKRSLARVGPVAAARFGVFVALVSAALLLGWVLLTEITSPESVAGAAFLLDPFTLLYVGLFGLTAWLAALIVPRIMRRSDMENWQSS